MNKRSSLNKSHKVSSKAITKRAKSKRTKFGRDLIRAAKQIAAHVRGEIELPRSYVMTPKDVKGIRQRSGLSQSKFADAFGLRVRTVQEWEQGKSVPYEAAITLLRVIDRNPDAVCEALAR